MVTTSVRPQIHPFQELLSKGSEIVVRGVSKDEYIRIADRFPEYRMEREPNGEITIMAPVKGGTSFRENDLSYYVTHWSKTTKKGRVASPSGGFDLPNGSTKCPDVAWLSSEKMDSLSAQEIEEQFLPVVPDFIVEIRSKSDRLKKVQSKMEKTWIANGVRLAWLIDPYKEKAYIYRADGSKDEVEGFDQKLSGEDVMPSFELDLSEFKLFGKK